MLNWALALALATALSAPQSALPASPPPQEPAPLATATLEDIVVERRRLETMVRDFVGEVGAPARRRGLARWQGEICVGVVNIRPEVGQYIADRVSEVGLNLGLSVGDPGCRANIFIVFAVDSAGLANAMVDENRQAFRRGVGGLDRGNPALRDFRSADRPVRWWHVSMPTNSETGRRAVRLPGDVDPTTGQPNAPVVATFAASRLNSQIRDDMSKVMIIVDVDQLGETNLVQLADYLAFISLVQVDPDGETASYDTILNLFDAPMSVDGLTEWDASYLESLYRVQDSPVQRINPRAQAGAMAADMLRERRRAREAAAEGEDAPPEQD
jgi:hypothetical protein